MYLRFFGLQQEPFSIAPDPHFLCMSERHREALAHLRYGLQSNGGFVVLSGEVGAGKTTLCRYLVDQLPRRCNVAYLFNPQLTAQELLQSVCADFGIASGQPGAAGEAVASIKTHIDALNDYLLTTHAVGQHNVLIIDEAQALSPELLEQLRLLTNLETDDRKLLQIVLVGQPELRDMLERPELTQLAQRVVARFHLGTLSEAETETYIRHRLRIAGLSGALPFDAGALRRIHGLAQGVPRRINLLCDRALLGAYAASEYGVRAPMIDQAAGEVFGTVPTPPPKGVQAKPVRAGLALGVAAALAMAVTLVGLTWTDGAGPGHVQAASSGTRGFAKGSQPPIVPITAPSPPTRLVTAMVSAPVSASMAMASLAASAAAAAPMASSSSAASAASVASGAAGAAGSLVAAPVTAMLAQRGNEPWLSDSEFAALLPATLLDEDQAWRSLAPLWLPTTPAGEACAAAASLGVHCFKRRGDLGLLRQLDRPVLLPLYGADGVAHFAHLVGLAGAGVRLKMAGQVVRITPQTLATLWRGEFGTLWRAPPGYTAAHPQPDADWLAVQLAHWSGAKLPQNKRDSNQASKSLNGSTGSLPNGQPGGPPNGPSNGQSARPLSPALRTQLSQFQRAERLDVTGQANAMTLMRLNRISGISEPRLPR